jgi:transcriptional regulator with XRE-family HTH domain
MLVNDPYFLVMPPLEPPTLGDIVARNVAAERVRRKLKQEELAERLGWARSSVGHLESGRRKVTVSDLPALCRALGVDLAVLLHGADPEDLQVMNVQAM